MLKGRETNMPLYAGGSRHVLRGRLRVLKLLKLLILLLI